ncbi:predicted protein [Naegleria gruberi]|uniref:Predicted protein n=1 Tax=Naegleria gruberi TaxID=5762 RepID=D2VQW6_NAEGR|nr:uncharacterized protein NAEGRDRAFT_51536 [Naegleria gruberi]EFC40707.1 predicted protein [Naegleria gruberi]|eukprot:XP_002673451.1 predicted protein [Naegleria gruberi strain NEG-M]
MKRSREGGNSSSSAKKTNDFSSPKSLVDVSASSSSTNTNSSNREKFSQQLTQGKDQKRRGTSSSYSSKQTSGNSYGDSKSMVDKKKRSELIKHFQANYNKRYALIQYRHIDIKVDKSLTKKSKDESEKESADERKATCDNLYSLWKRNSFIWEMIEDFTKYSKSGGGGFDLFNFPNLSIELTHYLLCLIDSKKKPQDLKSLDYKDVVTNNVQLPSIYHRGAEDQATHRFQLSFVNSMRSGKEMVLLRMRAYNSTDEEISEDLRKLATHSSFAIARAVSVYQLFNDAKVLPHSFEEYGNYTCLFSSPSFKKTSPATSYVKHKAEAFSLLNSIAQSNKVISKNEDSNKKKNKKPSTISKDSSTTATDPQENSQQRPLLKIKERLRRKNANHFSHQHSNKNNKKNTSSTIATPTKKKRKMDTSDDTTIVVEATATTSDVNNTATTTTIENQQSSSSEEKKKQEKTKRKYEEYLPLNEMWKEYMKTTLGPSSLVNNETLLKVDYHGCIFKVVKSKCGSYVGKEGIMIKESENTFQILSRENKTFTIPKNGSIFQFTFEKEVINKSPKVKDTPKQQPQYKHFQVEIIGTQFCFRTYDRASKRFKRRDIIDL